MWDRACEMSILPFEWVLPFPLPRALLVSHGLELRLPVPPAKSSAAAAPLQPAGGRAPCAAVASATSRRPSSLCRPRLRARPETSSLRYRLRSRPEIEFPPP
jgi:hypothetical protein